MTIPIMSTIRGQHIRLVRPEKIIKPIIYKSELPIIRYNKRSKQIKDHSGRVEFVCVKLLNGAIRALATPCTHIDVCEKMVGDVDNVKEVGWQLDNGEYLWR